MEEGQGVCGERTAAQPLSWGKGSLDIPKRVLHPPQKPWLSVNLHFKEQESKKYRIYDVEIAGKETSRSGAQVNY